MDAGVLGSTKTENEQVELRLELSKAAHCTDVDPKEKTDPLGGKHDVFRIPAPSWARTV